MDEVQLKSIMADYGMVKSTKRHSVSTWKNRKQQQYAMKQ